ncbi:4Fe-4S dicluster domain-containing protein [Desulfococcaceae bacterium HSG7]|nr:4Fe-4S dicluster domain-containing protein [Desulfococcaceae bacterium HSG7]
MPKPIHQFIPATAKNLVQEVMKRSGQNLTACYQCRRCAAGCPVAEETGYMTPDRLIRMIVTGDCQGVFNNKLVWQCVSCLTCGARCPNDIKTAKINDTLKQMTLEARVKPLTPKVAFFHDAFTTSATRWGRVNEPEFMSFYELKNFLNDTAEKNLKAFIKEVRQQVEFGAAMAKLRRLHFGFEMSQGRREIKQLLKKHQRMKKGQVETKENQ